METTKSVTNLIGNSFQQWDKTRPIVISAPTGTGKTTFILHTLLPYAAANNRSICYMGNRRILKEQVKKQIPAKYEDYISVINYQSSISDIEEAAKDCEYWILDEAHFFLSDASFNTKIKVLFDYFKRLYRQHICVFMTATPEYLYILLHSLLKSNDLFRFAPLPCPESLDTTKVARLDRSQFISVEKILKYKEISLREYKSYCKYYDDNTREWKEDLDYIENHYKSYFQQTIVLYQSIFDQIKRCCLVYEMIPDYTYIRPCYFRDEAELVDMIVHTPINEKWIIFVSNKSSGHNIINMLLKSDVFDVAYLDANANDFEGRKARKSIINEGYFSQRVLICTKVLDNGINIIDTSVKHISIIKANETAFIQMLGRKRIDRQCGETVSLYIMSEPNSTMRRYFNQKYLKILLFLYEFLYYRDPHYYPYNPEGYHRPRTAGGLDKRYTEGGHYKAPYKNYIEHVESMDDDFRRYAATPEQKSQHMSRLLLESFQIREINKNQLVYEYYQMLSMFERYQNKVNSIKEEEVIEDTMWLEEQLRWIGLSYDQSRWNTIVFGYQQAAKKQLLDFLFEHQGILSLEYEEQLKSLVLKYLAELRPEPKESHSKASFKTVVKVLNKYGFPYVLSKNRKSLNGRQRYWWVVNSSQ